ncbi:MAG: hypothetical protein KDK45_18480, partial [Leptospiraceae bacterium]|nr:hypothetical protein [Leptospiraceae bacterium]
MSTILELWQANRKDYSDNFKVTLSLWINLLFAIVFFFFFAVLPVGVLLLIAFLLTLGSTLLFFYYSDKQITRYVNTLILVYYFSYFVYGSSGAIEMHFHFAFTMAILALYNDWKPIIFISLLYGLHH